MRMLKAEPILHSSFTKGEQWRLVGDSLWLVCPDCQKPSWTEPPLEVDARGHMADELQCPHCDYWICAIRLRDWKPPIVSESLPFIEGRAARRFGKPLSDNPGAAGSRVFDEWARGWNS